MSDWKFLNEARVREPMEHLNIPKRFCSDDSYGFSGMFRFNMQGRMVRVIASDGGGWQHVSVSIERDKRTPTWEMMCVIKGLFWEDEDCVVQYHPPASVYVDFHPGCLHLWKPLLVDLPMPDPIMVGPMRKDKDGKRTMPVPTDQATNDSGGGDNGRQDASEKSGPTAPSIKVVGEEP